MPTPQSSSMRRSTERGSRIIERGKAGRSPACKPLRTLASHDAREQTERMVRKAAAILAASICLGHAPARAEEPRAFPLESRLDERAPAPETGRVEVVVREQERPVACRIHFY